MNAELTLPRRTLLDMNAYQWSVILAAWLGWGFDIFDSLLMNYVAPNAVPTLLGIPLGTPAAQSATLWWTGVLTSILLIGWCAGGVIFGKVTDRIGRTKTLLLTMLLYAVGTAACSVAPNIWVLVACRIVSALGIGGEWAAGAAMVAEVVPENRRVEAGALLYTASPVGLFLATFVRGGRLVAVVPAIVVVSVGAVFRRGPVFPLGGRPFRRARPLPYRSRSELQSAVWQATWADGSTPRSPLSP